MLSKKKVFTSIILLILSILVNLLSHDSFFVENNYSSNFYVSFSKTWRALFSWIPFSFGDILYLLVAIWLIYAVVKLLRFKNKINYFQNNWKTISINAFIKLSCIYIIFNIFWGLNYNRLGIAHQINLKIEKYSKKELIDMNELLVLKMNACKSNLLLTKQVDFTNKEMFLQTKNAYDTAAKKYPFLAYKNVSIKKSMWGWLGNYLGFLGYYNPFTGEAQINTTGPKFTQPFTACHEVAHQLGYAKEMEANFVGYLAASNSNNTAFQYAVYADLFLYANKTLYYADTTAAMDIRKNLMPEVITDFKNQRLFYAQHKSIFEPMVRYIYGKFLEQNEQPLGNLSYDEVTAFIIAYHKKYGTI